MRSLTVAITGHTSGIGRALAKHLIANGHGVLGFSRSTGHDISLEPARRDIIDCSANADVFINNAYHQYAQVNLLYELHSRFSGSGMLVVNIGSNSSDGIKPHPWHYSVHKAALDKAAEQLSYQKVTCKVSNLRLGYVDVPRVADIVANKLPTGTVCAALDFIIARWLEGHCVRELTLLP